LDDQVARVGVSGKAKGSAFGRRYQWFTITEVVVEIGQVQRDDFALPGRKVLVAATRRKLILGIGQRIVVDQLFDFFTHD
jgi:hypothetical protein